MMLLKTIKWFFSPSKKPIIEEHIDLHSKLIDIEEKYQSLLMNVKRLEDENLETANTLYEIMHFIEAVDARIDILMEHCKIKTNV